MTNCSKNCLQNVAKYRCFHFIDFLVKKVQSLDSLEKPKKVFQYTLLKGRTRNAPPPAASITIAKNLGLTAQKVESHEFFVILILS